MLATAMPMKQHDFTECRLHFYWQLLEPYVSAGQIHLVLMMFLHWCLSGSCWSLFHDAFSLQPWVSQPPSAWISLHPSFIPKTLQTASQPDIPQRVLEKPRNLGSALWLSMFFPSSRRPSLWWTPSMIVGNFMTERGSCAAILRCVDMLYWSYDCLTLLVFEYIY